MTARPLATLARLAPLALALALLAAPADAVAGTTTSRAKSAASSKSSRAKKKAAASARRSTRARSKARSTARSGKAKRTVKTVSHKRRGLKLMPLSIAAPVTTSAGSTLRGSRGAVAHAYDAAVARGVAFTASRAEVEERARDGQLVPLARTGASYRTKGVALPYVLPTTRGFVTTFAARYQDACGEPMTVTSAIRPTSVRLPNSVEQSVHPTGMAVDLRIPRGSCRSWMRRALLDLEDRGVVDATEERHPAHFHVVVFREP